MSELLSYLQQGNLLTDKICDNLKAQFERMSISEQQVLLRVDKHKLDHSQTLSP